MKKEEKLSLARSMAKNLGRGEHVVFQINKKILVPFVVNDDGLKSIIASHPRSYIGAYHAK